MHVLVEVSVTFRQLPPEGAVDHQSFSSITHPGVVLPLLGPCPLGIPTELPGTGVALPHASPASASTPRGAPRRGARGGGPPPPPLRLHRLRRPAAPGALPASLGGPTTPFRSPRRP